MNRIKKLSRWSVVGVGMALLLGVGGLQIAGAAQLQPLSFQLPHTGYGCEGECVESFGTGLIYENNWYNLSSCHDDGDIITCYYVWEFA
ncbi:MAG: hypothetical protein U0974_06790 [Gemmatimonadales bacterium]|nr:hypothetical protein [Gemmatimonadales bacterium]MDZ4389420.1 hypothetical protein [Gemmatimonadales bacterium]